MAFVDRLREIQRAQSTSPRHDKAMAKLEEIVEGLQQVFDRSKKKLTFGIEPGYMTNYGLQYKVTVTYLRDKKDILFRAYVPQDGYPVSLDLDGEQALVCVDESSLEDTLARFFGRSQISLRVKALKSL